jgi:hypothetical protein|tara:strand:+ start:22 stop:222 length:201 start_codon:yes stop_codon:yes gene_type:complete
MNYANEIEYIESKLDERRTEVEQHLGRGAAKNYDEYQKLCGVIQGLDYAKQILLDLAQRMEIDANE